MTTHQGGKYGGGNVRLMIGIKRKNILVVGDVMLDTYYYGDVERISPEAPVPVFRKKKEGSVLGGAANVAANLAAAGQNVSVMAVVGKDEAGERLKSIFSTRGMDTGLLLSLDRRTTEKTRLLAANNQQVLRLDVEDTEPLSDGDCGRMASELRKRIGAFDLILMSDYLKGLLTHRLTQEVISMAGGSGIPVVIDVKGTDYRKYEGATLLKPNRRELEDLTGQKTGTEEDIIRASEELRANCRCKYVLTTCGHKGMVLVGEGGAYPVKAAGREVFDVTGAGDTAIAYLAACMANGLGMRESIDIANLAAGIQVSKVGTSSVSWGEVRGRMAEGAHDVTSKILNEDSINGFREGHGGETVVFTNGCFDILHVGHIRYLQEAARLGDLLVVGLNSDASVRRLKGAERPINSELERAETLCALSFVDYVVVFDEDTPLQLIKKIQPDVLVKGGDYKPDEVVGKEVVEGRGGCLRLLPFIEGKSTSGIIERIRN